MKVGKTGVSEELHDEALYDLFPLHSTVGMFMSRRMKGKGRRTSAYIPLGLKPERQRLLERHVSS
jgi:hypothetical protein